MATFDWVSGYCSQDGSGGRDGLDGFISDSEPVSSQLQRDAAQAGRDLAHERSDLAWRRARPSV